MRARVFLDANVLFWAASFGSTTEALVERLLNVADVFTSELAAEEARRNLLTKRPRWIDAYDRLLSRMVVLPDRIFPLSVELAEKDRPLLCAAIRSSCTHFATGDRRDFGHLYDMSVDGVRVISLLRLAELVRDAWLPES